MKQTNENAVQDQDVIELGVATLATKGVLAGKEPIGDGTPMLPGISED